MFVLARSLQRRRTIPLISSKHFVLLSGRRKKMGKLIQFHFWVYAQPLKRTYWGE